MRGAAPRFAGFALLASALAGGCGDTGKPPSWDTLLSDRIADARPDCKVSVPVPGKIAVACPDLPPAIFDVAPTAAYCLRGARDCEYAITQMVLMLPPPKPAP